MKRLPTDLDILNVIYERYYDTFTQYTDGDDSRSEKLYVHTDDELLVKQRGKFMLSIEKAVDHENLPTEGVNPIDG